MNNGVFIMSNYISPKCDFCKSGIYEFKKDIAVNESDIFKINIFAVTRYILYINDEYICEGPCRGSEEIRYYDTVETDKMRIGQNSIKVVVMHVAEKRKFSSAFKEKKPVLLFEAIGNGEKFSSDTTWECTHNKAHTFSYFWYVAPNEHITGNDVEKLELEKLGSFDFGNGYFEPYGIVNNYYLKSRPIPMIYPGDCVELKEIKRGDGFVELDAGEYTTAKLEFDIEKNSDVKIIYSECYSFNGEKSLRDDINGELEGMSDSVVTHDEAFTFKPFWFRAFRFIRIEAKNVDEAVKAIRVKKCHYPLDITGDFECSDENYNRMRHISINTMLCCMHEIFVDCPFYEQQQYVMDSAIESEVLMRMSNDVRMIKKCISEFAASQTEEGFICANYPSDSIQIIPGFSFFWIFLLRTYLEYSKDIEFVRGFSGTMDKILECFEEKVLKDGLICTSCHWDYVDWVPEWGTRGIPNIKSGEAITVYNMYYACALKDAEFICRCISRNGLADEYHDRYIKLKDKINNLCYDKEKHLYKDGTETKEYSMHTTVWAILSELVTNEEAVKMLESFSDESVRKCSFSMNFYLFRALEKCGCYDKVFEFFNGWKRMIDMHCTTWCENPDSPRSECHAWSSAPLYEFSANILGVKYSFDDTIRISPVIGDLDYANGSVPTRFGDVKVSWKKEKDIFGIKIESPESIEKELTLPDGTVKYFNDAEIEFKTRG